MAIYMIRVDGSPYIKIGHAVDIANRVKSLQGAHVEDVRLVRLFEGDRRDEVAVHRRFGAFFVRGEWYRPCDEILTGSIGLPELPLPILPRHGLRARHHNPLAGSLPGEKQFRAWHGNHDATYLERTARILGRSVP